MMMRITQSRRQFLTARLLAVAARIGGTPSALNPAEDHRGRHGLAISRQDQTRTEGVSNNSSSSCPDLIDLIRASTRRLQKDEASLGLPSQARQ